MARGVEGIEQPVAVVAAPIGQRQVVEGIEQIGAIAAGRGQRVVGAAPLLIAAVGLLRCANRLAGIGFVERDHRAHQGNDGIVGVQPFGIVERLQRLIDLPVLIVGDGQGE